MFRYEYIIIVDPCLHRWHVVNTVIYTILSPNSIVIIKIFVVIKVFVVYHTKIIT